MISWVESLWLLYRLLSLKMELLPIRWFRSSILEFPFKQTGQAAVVADLDINLKPWFFLPVIRSSSSPLFLTAVGIFGLLHRSPVSSRDQSNQTQDRWGLVRLDPGIGGELAPLCWAHRGYWAGTPASSKTMLLECVRWMRNLLARQLLTAQFFKKCI